jgi:transposase
LRPCSSPKSTRTRILEDIPETIHPVVTEHTIHRAYCPCCKKLVEPKVPDALPGATLGNRLSVLSAHWHYGLGMPVSQIVELLDSHLHFPVSKGGLVQMWKRLADHLDPWYEQLADEVRDSAVLHADETGWRVNGQTHWLWCFTNDQSTVYLIDKSRGSPALYAFFKEALEGVLVTDFWAAYDSIANGKRQFCLAHLLRELEKVDVSNSSAEWSAFSKKTQRLFKDALRLRKRDDFSSVTYSSRIERLYARLVDLMLIESRDDDVQRLTKRLQKYWDELLTFLEEPNVPPTNNHAEREIRPAGNV